jgi:hypothetical protein
VGGSGWDGIRRRGLDLRWVVCGLWYVVWLRAEIGGFLAVNSWDGLHDSRWLHGEAWTSSWRMEKMGGSVGSQFRMYI